MREVFKMEREPSVEPSCLNFSFFHSFLYSLELSVRMHHVLLAWHRRDGVLKPWLVKAAG